MRTTHTARSSQGFILISTLFMMSLMLALVSAYAMMTSIEWKINKRSGFSSTGFYTAEAGLNIRAEEIRQIFVGYNRPEGTSPDPENACEGGNQGADDFACATYEVGGHTAVTYVEEDPSNPLILTIPPGELYQNLSAQEYRYTVKSNAIGPDDRVEASLELRFKSRLVPLFQFVAFYDKDLEILPGPTMLLSGPIHTNGDLYLNANNSLSVDGQVATAGVIYRGRKNDNSCMSKPVRVKDPISYVELINPCPSRTLVDDSDIDPYNGMVQMNVQSVTVPEPEALDPTEGQIYWDKADLRLTLHLNGSNNPVTTYGPTGVEVRNANHSVNASATTDLHNCAGSISGRPVGYSSSFYSNREGGYMRLLEVDMQALLNCIHTESLMGFGKGLDDNSEGGLVFHFSVDGPNSGNQQSYYGFRIVEGDELQASVAAPSVRGMTVVSDQAAFVEGHYNRVNKIPAAILADAFNVLSENWNGNDYKSTQSLSNRNASNTTFNAAILACTDTTGGVEGAGGQGGAYNGGLENYPRFHENWSGDTFLYRGSFVSLNNCRHSNGNWVYGGSHYNAPNRDWDYDTDFNDAANLPPLTPRFVYLRQQLFVRKYELE